MRSDEEHPSLFRLKAHLGGETDPELVRHLEGCADCRAAVDTLAKQREAFLARETAPETFADNVLRAAGKAPASRRRAGVPRWIWAAVAASAAAVIALVIVWRQPPRPGPGSGTRIRGGALQLQAVLVRRGSQTRHVEPFQVVAGDEVNVELSLERSMRVSAGGGRTPAAGDHGSRGCPRAGEVSPRLASRERQLPLNSPLTA
jgi:predicted anti-sigma-YlaC factor YlaD